MSSDFDALAAELVGRGLPVNRCDSPVPTLLVGHGCGIITVLATDRGWDASATYNAWTRPIVGPDLLTAVLEHVDTYVERPIGRRRARAA